MKYEQKVYIKKQRADIDRFEQMLVGKYDSTKHYHSLLITFSSFFDSIFAALQENINPNTQPLCML